MSQISTLENIFGTPIQAIINADYMAARKSSEYIKEFGFNQIKKDDDSYEDLGALKETSFCYDTMGNGGKLERRVMKIPSLSLLPLPLLHVDNADFDFSVRIIDSSDDVGDGKLNAALVPQRSVEKGNSSAPHLDANIHVKMKVVQSDMPAGLSNLLALMGSNTINQISNKIEMKDSLIKVQNGKYFHSELILKNSKGEGIPNALVNVSFKEEDGILLACNRKRWNNGCSMLTDENGSIRFVVAYDSKETQKTGTVIPLAFAHGNYTKETLNLYVE